MPYSRNRGLALRPVTRIKHVVDTNGGISGAAASTTDVIFAVDDPPSTTSMFTTKIPLEGD